MNRGTEQALKTILPLFTHETSLVQTVSMAVCFKVHWKIRKGDEKSHNLYL